MKTPRASKCMAVQGGKYLYIGLQCYLASVKDSSMPLQLMINIDGASIYKSSTEQMWPILGCFDDSDPFVIAVFLGTEKPNVHNFLADLISDLKQLRDQVELRGVICDAPARAMVKCTKGHAGYSSCDRCTTVGSYVDSRVIFLDTKAPLRTDDSFRVQSDISHHNNVSPFTELNINMISDFPYDYMHLVCLGVVRRFLTFLLSGPSRVRISRQMSSRISQILLSFTDYFPSDFSRKPRSLDCIRYWKATEYRSFLFFTGGLSLANVVDTKVYKLFLLLQSAIFILCDPLKCHLHVKYAHQFLTVFVKKCEEVFGKQMMVYNVHALLHVADDITHFGPLDTFSAFKFETMIHNLVRLLHAKHLPLQQLQNRLCERGFEVKFPNRELRPSFKKSHDNLKEAKTN